MKTRKIMTILLMLLLTVALCCACGSEPAADDPQPSQGDAPAEGQEAARDTVTIQLYVEPDTLDVQQNSSLITAIMCRNLYSGLVRLDSNNEIVGDLAESWEWNEDYSQLTFQLRDGIFFSDGSPITAQDVEYSYKRCMDINFGITYYAYIESVTATSDTELVITLNQPYSVFLSALCTTYFSVMSQAAIEAGMDVGVLPNVTSGPYYAEAWNTGADLVLKANEYYYRGVAPIKTADLIFMPDENTALIALESGDVDLLMGNSIGLTGSSVAYVDEMEGCSLLAFDSTGYNFLTLNQNVEYFADLNVRKAIDCGINRDDIILAALDGYGIPANIPALPGIAGYLDGYEATAYDPEAAKAYLAESAYPDGFSFVIQVCTDQWLKVAQVIQSQLGQIGITVEIQEFEMGTLITNICTNNYEGGIVSWSNGSGDVTNIASMYIAGDTNCFANLKDNSMGELFNQSVTVVGDERDAVLAQLYDIIDETVPYIGMYWPTSYYAINSDLQVSENIGLLGDFLIYSMSWK